MVVVLLFKFKCSTIGAAAVATSNGAVYDFAYDANDVTLGFEGNRSSHCESGYVVGLWSHCLEYSGNVLNLYNNNNNNKRFDWLLCYSC